MPSSCFAPNWAICINASRGHAPSVLDITCFCTVVTSCILTLPLLTRSTARPRLEKRSTNSRTLPSFSSSFSFWQKHLVQMPLKNMHAYAYMHPHLWDKRETLLAAGFLTLSVRLSVAQPVSGPPINSQADAHKTGLPLSSAQPPPVFPPPGANNEGLSLSWRSHVEWRRLGRWSVIRQLGSRGTLGLHRPAPSHPHDILSTSVRLDMSA
ncbi:unnamed protein product [Protopolystoma xenopodis]|uniref:Uncharacterized protein n=1 Tax=Protopolystoma xenopodis TaxID=117903 RepID=A0A3S5CRI4_9PLAT|nr:unnamed protein product [Protopolystoma xenopodis]